MAYRTYIYLLQDKSHGTNIFKIGITTEPFKHLQWYTEGSRFLVLFTCPYNGYLHNILFSKFRSSFLERFDLGPNYFEGSIEMGKKEFTKVCTLVNDICVDYPPPSFEFGKCRSASKSMDKEPLSEYKFDDKSSSSKRSSLNRQCKIPTPKASLWSRKDFRTRSVSQNNVVRFSRPLM